MSQNRTVFPGVGSDDDYTHQGQQPSGMPYSRSSNHSGNGTVFPGMDGTQVDPMPSPRTTGLHQSGSHKPIVGFLYSISKTKAGEYWPLHVGQNLIGSSSECDIVLGEGTVSGKHANLHINQMKRPEKVEATMSDLGSTNGTIVNDNSVSVARPVECVNGDIIVIGENYELLLLLIDTKAIGLHVSETFIPKEVPQDPVQGPHFNPGAPGMNPTVNNQDFPPRFNGPQNPYDGGSRPTDSTFGLDPSSNGGFSTGGTVGMQ